MPTARFLIALASFWAVAVAADTAVHNVVGYTPTDDGVREFSVLVFDADGKVVATGDEALLEDLPDAERVDGGGRFVLPGLTDAHAHVYSQGFLTVSLNLLGAPSGHVVPIREIRLAAGAEFVVVITGAVMTMPGLPRVPAANGIYVNDAGEIEGLF